MAWTFGWNNVSGEKQTEDFGCNEGTRARKEAHYSSSNWKSQETISWKHWVLCESNPEGENSQQKRNGTASCKKAFGANKP